MGIKTICRELKQKLAANTIDDHFALLQSIVKLFNEHRDDEDVQDIILRCLDSRDKFESQSSIVNALAREAGLFPYLDFESLPTRDKIACSMHLSPNKSHLPIFFHAKQAEIFYRLAAGESLALSAPTSFGKSLLIDSIVASNIYNNIVIVVPTIALIDETRKRLTAYSENYKIITSPLQQLSKRNIYILTQERVIIDEFVSEVDFFVIDEFYKLDTSGRDKDRSVVLNKAFYKLLKKTKRFYLLGPNIDNVNNMLKSKLTSI